MAPYSDGGGYGTPPEHERVYRSLRRQILNGEMVPGGAVTLRGLAEEHRVSITPVREAVRRLVAERALTMTPSGRVSVPVPDAAAMEELFRARLLLEPELALRASPNLTPAAIRDIERCNQELYQAFNAGDVAGYIRGNTAFHAAIYTRANAPALLALVQSVWLQSAPLMRRICELVGDDTLRDYHIDAIAAAHAGDARALASAIRDDVMQGAALLAKARLDGLHT